MKKRLPWFRLYTEVLDDPKVQRLPAHLFKTWVNLLCLAGELGGTLPSVDDIAFRLRMSAHDAASQLDELILAGLIDIGPENERTPHNWPSRQFASDCSTERVRKHRKQKEKQTRNAHETLHETPPDTEADTEAEQKQSRVRAETGAKVADEADQIGGLNGSTGEIVNGVAKFLNHLAPDYTSARRIIASNVGIYGDRAVRDGYAELMADVADNKVRVPSVKALVGYFKTAGERPARSVGKPANDFAAQRIERARSFVEKLNAGGNS